ncbi:phosphatase PAP2 family protein [Spiroplasma tabanidicola]|uniref:Phosphatase PAP2 family protein n=1 Tax=Spiroplasma tabanidicola TaxID=324079 RepID=A0A6I6C9P1_9MOLU|nr:phosphatase PAP2 family protein [Spiroplasma tabanidicola]QGS51645.1 phosphatase PAP2 family protein [Spiroplasma tabanidicola]
MLFKTKKNNAIFWVLSFAFFFTIFTAFAFFDFKISKSVLDSNVKNDGFASFIMYFFNIYGHSIICFPVYFSFAILTLLLFKRAKGALNKVFYIIIQVVYVVVFIIALCFFSFYKTIEDWNDNANRTQYIMQLTISSLIIVLAIITITLTLLFSHTNKIVKTKPDIEKIAFQALLCLIYISISMAVVYFLKIAVARPRPREIFATKDPLNEFKYPFEISTKNRSGQSFPSGHALSSTSMFGFLFFFDKETKKKNIKYILMIIFSLLTFLTDISRVLILAHFITDVLMANFLACCSYYLVKDCLAKYLYKKDQKIKNKDDSEIKPRKSKIKKVEEKQNG